MTLAELTQVFVAMGDEHTWRGMGDVRLSARTEGQGEIAALAIAEARVCELWARRGFTCWAHEVLSDGASVYRFHDPYVCDSREYDTSDRIDCLHAALMAAMETL